VTSCTCAKILSKTEDIYINVTYQQRSMQVRTRAF